MDQKPGIPNQLKPNFLAINLGSMMPVIIIAVILLTGYFVVKPMWAKFGVNQKAIAKERADIKRLQAKLDALNAVNDSSLEKRFVEAQKALPEDKNVAGVIFGLARLAQENSLTITLLQLRPGKIASSSADLTEVNIRLGLDGDIKNIDAFVTQLKHIRRVLGITKLNGTSAQSSAGFSASLELVLYALGLPEKLPGYADALPDLSQTKLKLVDDLATYTVYTDLSGGGVYVPPTTQTQSPPPATSSASPTPQATARGKATATPRPTRTP